MFVRVWLNLESKFEDEEEGASLLRSSSPPLRFLIISFYYFISICPKINDIFFISFWLPLVLISNLFYVWNFFFLLFYLFFFLFFFKKNIETYNFLLMLVLCKKMIDFSTFYSYYGKLKFYAFSP